MWFLWSQSGWVQVSCSISYKGGFLHTVQLSTITSCQRVLWQSSSGKVIWVQEGMEFQRGSPLHSSQNRLWGCTISTGHPNTRPTRVSSKDWLAQTVTDKKMSSGEGSEGKKRKKNVLPLFQSLLYSFDKRPLPSRSWIFHYMKWKGKRENYVKFTTFFFNKRAERT